MVDLSYQGCESDTDTEKGFPWRCKDSQGGWKLRWLVPRLKVRKEEDFSYIRCVFPMMYQLMAVKKTSFPEMEGYKNDEIMHKRKAHIYENTTFGIDEVNVRKKSSITNMDQALKQNMALHSEQSKANIPVRLSLTDITQGSTSSTHQEKGKSVRMKSSRRINFNDIDDEDEYETESKNNRFEGISNEYRDHGDPIFGCESCGALLWHADNSIGNIHANSESYSLCCGQGKVMLPTTLKNPPKLLMDLINRYHPKSTNFIDNIRHYNSIFCSRLWVANKTSREQKDLRSETYSKLAKLASDPDSGVTIRDLFITFTCNPNWLEILRFVAEKGLKSDERPDAITRVFKQKLDSLMKDFKEKCWFGHLRGVRSRLQWWWSGEDGGEGAGKVGGKKGVYNSCLFKRREEG
nr:NBS-LRR protein [Tanacetum cinerariifolium]